MTWFGKLKKGLYKTSSLISGGVSKIFTHGKLNEDDIAELEDLLISADLGSTVTNNIIQEIERRKFDKSISVQEAKLFLASYITDTIKPVAKPLFSEIGWPLFPFSENPESLTVKQDLSLKPRTTRVLMVCGVNGNGKTTTSGKIAYRMTKLGYKVSLAACDTFRAAAVEQLKIWADHSNCGFIAGEQGSDSASVAYNALQKSMQDQVDLLILDTAGRLYNKINLMDELKKVKRVIQKLNPDAPHDTVLVIDGTTGQNAYQQIEMFNQAIELNGLIVTKLDSSAKGGFVVGIAQKYQIPIRAIGVGEGIDDLNALIPEVFAQAIVGL